MANNKEDFMSHRTGSISATTMDLFPNSLVDVQDCAILIPKFLSITTAIVAFGRLCVMIASFIIKASEDFLP